MQYEKMTFKMIFKDIYMLFVKIHTATRVSLTAEDLNVSVCLRHKRHKANLAQFSPRMRVSSAAMWSYFDSLLLGCKM